MGVDTGAYKNITTYGKYLDYQNEFEDVEDESFLYPNGELIKLNYVLEEFSKEKVSIRHLLINDTYGYENPQSVINQVENISFEEGLDHLNKVKKYIIENIEELDNLINQPLKKINYLIMLFEKRYYVTYGY